LREVPDLGDAAGLARLRGRHNRGLQKMIDADAYCPDGGMRLAHHVPHCVTASP